MPLSRFPSVPLAESDRERTSAESPVQLFSSPEPDRPRRLTVLVPSYNEVDNVVPLVTRLDQVLAGIDAEVLFVDDSTDGTADAVRRMANSCRASVRVHQRPVAAGGLAGAVTEGLRDARGSHVVVMDGDLQHPPELVPRLLDAAERGHLDLVVASRHVERGDGSGLASEWRHAVSDVSTLLARAAFPRRVGRLCTDPMTGMFCVRPAAVDLDRLRPRGFKILLEIMARHDLSVGEIPLTFGPRYAGESKASWRHGMQFLLQLLALRLGTKSRFALVGALGSVVNLAVMWVALHLLGASYVLAWLAATEISILHNFVWQERFVFADRALGRGGRTTRLVQSMAFNNVEAAVRLPLLILLVSVLGLYAVLVQAVMLLVAFVVRFLFHARIVYRRPARVQPRRALVAPAGDALPVGRVA